MFGVEPKRGSTPGLPITTTAGENLVINPGGGLALAKPSYSEESTPQGIKIQIAARSMEEAKRILAGVKGKYPRRCDCKGVRERHTRRLEEAIRG